MNIASYLLFVSIAPCQNPPQPIQPAIQPILIKRALLLPNRITTDSQQAPPSTEKPKGMKPGVPGDGPPVFEIHASDESSIRASILDSTLELNTSFGQLVIPVKDVRKIEIGSRMSEEEIKAVNSAISKLIDADRKTRLLGREAVIAIDWKALPALRRTKKTITDPEILAGINDVESRLVSTLKEKGEKEIADRDTIQTDGSTFVGTIAASHLKILTGPFGEQKIKVSDIRSGRSLSADTNDDEGELISLPPNGMTMFQGQIGKVYRIRITGTNNGNIWGTGTYTLDSYLPLAAVHAGAIKINETGIVKVKMVQSPNIFTGTSQNGVGSMNFGQFPAGAYEFVKKKD